MPLLDPVRLWSTFEKLYAPRKREEPLDLLDKASVIIAMAMGAISTEEEEWRETLLGQARTEAELTRYHVNAKAVQVSLLLAHCEFATGHPNLAYLCLGSAVTKALAAGIHKAGRGSDSRSEANRTMWTLFCNESISCLMLGRPHLLDREMITIPGPDRTSFVAVLVQLCMTIRRTHKVYSQQEGSSISDLNEHFQSIHEELNMFSDFVKRDFGMNIGTPPLSDGGEKLMHHIVLSYRMPRAPSRNPN
ncbi:Transcription factor fungi [Macrophomina phaseolina MS6]|uniref:Transcription factor fungi n=1 Tax=Macrophomina phaseolina (strain MS6) TaxID=1126212 RepID=K2QNC6_MACPH|nr:Transcription factor fungi [Macrophomina phaseolina MS6]